MSRILNAFLVFVPIAIALQLLGHLDLLGFIVSALAIMPLAKLLGDSTEVLAGHYNPTAGALLNVTFGNAPEIFISIAAISASLPALVLASITGSILGNVLLVLGMSLVAGGIRHKELKFESFPFGLQASLLFIALTGLAVPTVFSIGIGRNVEYLSDTLAIVLIAVYGLGLLFTFSTHKHLFAVATRDNDYPHWSVGRALIVLGGSTILVALLSELLVGSISSTIRSLGVNELFLGAVVIGIIGNVPEHLTAIQMALKNKVDISIGIAAGSGAQVRN
jgi:Ca2+:H+ antiporter